MDTRLLMKQCVAEAFGTFCLVLAGTGAVIANDTSGGAVTLPGIAIVFGLIVMTMIYSIGDISGAHINPAVSIAFWCAGKFPAVCAAAYIVSQCVGAVLASIMMRIIHPAHEGLGATLPSGSAGQSFLIEVLLTLILMFVILNVSRGAKEKGITAGIAVGAAVGLDVLFGGPISGGSMNPARSLGPALVSGQLAHLWIYLLAPVVGAIMAVYLCKVLHPAED